MHVLMVVNLCLLGSYQDEQKQLLFARYASLTSCVQEADSIQAAV